MSTPIRKPTQSQVLAWMKANPDATEDEIYAFATGSPPSPKRFGTTGLLGKAVALGRGAAQGATFGLADEIVGGIEGAIRPGMSIGEGIANERAINSDVRENNKGAFLTGEIAGGVGQGVGAAKLAISRSAALASLLGRTSLGGRIGAGAAAGAAGGGAAGFGGAEGNPIERLDNAAIGAAAGAVGGAAMPVVGAGLRAIGNATGIRQAFVDPARESADLINETMRLDKKTPASVAIAREAEPDVPTSVLNLAGDNTRELATSAQARSNSAREIAEKNIDRVLEAERDNYVTQLRSVLNPKHKNIEKQALELRELREAHANVNFPPVLNETITDPKVAGFFREKEVMRAYMDFRDNQLTLARAGKIPAEEVPPEIYDIVAKDGGKKTARLNTVDIPLRSFHVVQQAINDAIDAGFKNGKTIPEARAKALQGALDVHMKAVETAHPKYGAARKVYRDDSSSIDALEAGLGNKIKKTYGRNIPNFKASTPEAVSEWLGGRRALAASSDPEAAVAAADVENYLLGVFGNVSDELEGKSGQAAAQWLDLPANRNRILAAFGDGAKGHEFISMLKRWKLNKRTMNVGRKGTSIKGDDSIPPELIDSGLLLGGVGSGRTYAPLASLGRILRGEHRMSDETANATLQTLFKGIGGQKELVEAVRMLNRAAEDQTRRRARNAAVAAGAASGAVSGAQN